MRWTDDYLLITTSQQKAVEFLKKVQRGFPEYGFNINLSKSLTNLPPNSVDENDDIKRLEGPWFPWCGLLFNCNNLDARCSYERYRGKFVEN